jgi:transcriptional regulator with XRE-family HTH domain
MATDQVHKRRESDLSPEQKARVEAIRAKHRTSKVRAEEARAREALDREYRETGTLKTTSDGTTMGDLVTFRRFVMSLRRERERLGLSLADVAEWAKIDKVSLSQLENGQQLNPTVHTLARYAWALGKGLTWGLTEEKSTTYLIKVRGVVVNPGKSKTWKSGPEWTVRLEDPVEATKLREWWRKEPRVDTQLTTTTSIFGPDDAGVPLVYFKRQELIAKCSAGDNVEILIVKKKRKTKAGQNKVGIETINLDVQPPSRPKRVILRTRDLD